ncbi:MULTISPECIES: RNA 2'-phosphotransferase [unclassified Rhizobium]|uniref:RNA 2'-phosphotransferase n=1 Tax=unclassified Rhizobium TaxID=2613769 RepID=UPI000EA9BF20|nr:MULTISPECIES: RNA 2'-phosphotransferase [unclassified Rhizobium]AYG66397.1 RNA 2'-phosphotransferase [Rhizobium sp. CCGE531]AYG72778.1 RNA 2'-phosphotransferase [Rhizobium sp. CCGE532]
MVSTKLQTEVSKFMSYVLRHAPHEAGLVLDSEGWVPFNDLRKAVLDRFDVTEADILEVIESNPKKRFTLLDHRIRAAQGHSVVVDLALSPATPPSKLFHGTSLESWPTIQSSGLKKMQRHHVHLSPDIETAKVVATRRKGNYIILEIDATRMHAEGHSFFVSDNGVWLTDHVPSQYLSPLSGPAS